MTRILLALALSAAPAMAQDYDCPPDVPSDSPRCVPTAGLASQAYAIGDRLSDEVPLDPANRADMPPLDDGEAFAVFTDMILRVEMDTRTIVDVIDVVPDEAN
jgi:hypothetical protein